MYDALLNCTGCVCTASELWAKAVLDCVVRRDTDAREQPIPSCSQKTNLSLPLSISVNSIGKAQMEKCYFGGKLISDIELFP